MGNDCRRSKVCSILASQFLFHLLISQFYTAAIDTISLNQSITEGQFLTSPSGIFELGFFSTSSSKNKYVGIWHKRISRRKVVWVANKNKPIISPLRGRLIISSNGNLVIMGRNGETIWTTNTTSSSVSSSVIAILEDSGNLQLKESSSTTQEGKVLWESFNYPSDTFLPNMKIGLNLITGDKLVLNSWKTEDDPSSGNFIVGLYPKKPVQAYVWNISNGISPYFRSGLWNGKSFIGIEGMDTPYFNGYSMPINNNEEMYFTMSFLNSSLISFLFVTSSGGLRHVTWDDGQNDWIVIGEMPVPQSPCEIYGTCGPNGVCNRLDEPVCSCLWGFEPKYKPEWRKGNWRDGCVRSTELQCGKNTSASMVKEDGFLPLRGMKLPDFSEFMEIFDTEKCKALCLKNCSCVGYAYVSGIWCLVWSGELIDVQGFSIGGEDLFLRLAASELISQKQSSVPKLAIIIPVVITFGICSFCVIGYMLFKRKPNPRGSTLRRRKRIQVNFVNTKETYDESPNVSMLRDGRNEGETPELQLYDFTSISVATNNFSLANKLGEGGFGPVYKGTLQNGQEIAIKRLSKSSGQGTEEFKNEVILISKLQHRNLVKLLGYCIDEEEQMLLYEYLPNKSLDAFIFDPRKRPLLDWNKRFSIIEGIARGLLYLHRDSRLRVIHRDLKASNILLDEDMNPKISDFGLARIFGGTQTMANTNRVVGTFGYMSPEYIMGGIFSEKSDVFSFGVLILEIVSSKRNNQSKPPSNLLVHTWRLWNEGKWQEIVDEALGDSYSLLELMKCIHVGLLCVQKRAVDRPTMSAVDLMLGSETDRPPPKEPPFASETSLESEFQQIVCSNDVTLTLVEGR